MIVELNTYGSVVNLLGGVNSTVAALFGATGSLTSPTGWLNANIYSNFLPLVVLLLTIGYGASAIAGQIFSQVKTSPLVTLKASLRAASVSPDQAIARASRSTSTACVTRAAPPG